jgi:hypothetical protein
MYIWPFIYRSLAEKRSEYYGKHAPFIVRVGLRSLVVLREPEHVKKVAEASKQRTLQGTESNFNDVIFGHPQIDGNDVNNEKFELARAALTPKYLTGPSLTTMIDLYASILSRNLNDKMFQVGSWTQIEDFWSFFEQILTRCSIEMLFGSAIFKQYPGLIKDFWKFDDAISGFIPGLPRILVSTTHQAPRDRLFLGIEKWLKANHSGSEFAKISSNDPDWNEYMGSKFIQERDDVLSKIPLVAEARAADMLCVMHRYVKRTVGGDWYDLKQLTCGCSANVNVVPSAIWSIIEILRKPQLAKQVVTASSRHTSTGSATHNVDRVARTPIFQSISHESARLHMAHCRTYTLEKDIALGERWTLPKGCTAISFSRDIAMNADVWAHARPRTVERPLEEFWAERFLTPDNNAVKASGRKQSKESIQTGNCNLEGLESLVVDFGDKQQLAFGSDYARAMQAATLGVLLSEFEMQLCDPQATDAAVNPIRKEAYGAVRPLDRIAVRIRKR